MREIDLFSLHSCFHNKDHNVIHTYALVKRTTFEKKKIDEVTSSSLKWENKIYEPKRSVKQFFTELCHVFALHFHGRPMMEARYVVVVVAAVRSS